MGKELFNRISAIVVMSIVDDGGGGGDDDGDGNGIDATEFKMFFK